MEWIQFDDVDTGTFQIKPLAYYDSARAARGAFDFPIIQKHLTVGNWIEIFRGTYRIPNLPDKHKTDLTQFRFVVAPSNGKIDDCRDWM